MSVVRVAVASVALVTFIAPDDGAKLHKLSVLRVWRVAPPPLVSRRHVGSKLLTCRSAAVVVIFPRSAWRGTSFGVSTKINHLASLSLSSLSSPPQSSQVSVVFIITCVVAVIVVASHHYCSCVKLFSSLLFIVVVLPPPPPPSFLLVLGGRLVVGWLGGWYFFTFQATYGTCIF